MAIIREHLSVLFLKQAQNHLTWFTWLIHLFILLWSFILFLGLFIFFYVAKSLLLAFTQNTINNSVFCPIVVNITIYPKKNPRISKYDKYSTL